MRNRGKEVGERFYGIDVGGTKIALTLGLRDGTILRKESFPSVGPEEALRRMIDFGKKNAPFLSIGVSCGSPLDAEKGVILCPPNLTKWRNVSIVRALTRALGAPAFLENDANACALAEWRLGAGKGMENVVFLTFGTGMGAGLILNGRLYSGAGGNAGEVGHLRLRRTGPIGYGKAGSFEGFCSGGGIAQLGVEMARSAWKKGRYPAYCHNEEEVALVSAKSIAQAAERGDETAKRVYALSGERLGEGLAILVDLLNPEAIVIGSIFARAGELLLPSLKKSLAREALPSSLARCLILPSALGESLGDEAALSLAADGWERRGEDGAR